MGRSAATCVKRYLDLLSRQPRRGSAGDLKALRLQLESVEDRILTTRDALTRLQLHQEAIDLQAKVNLIETEQGDFDQIEEDFIDSVASWAAEKGVSREALREAGVPLRVLRRAGLS